MLSGGLGFELANHLHALGHTVYATIRSSKTPDFPEGITVIQNIDVGVESAGKSIVSALQGNKLDLVFMNAGLFKMDVRINIHTSRLTFCARALLTQHSSH